VISLAKAADLAIAAYRLPVPPARRVYVRDDVAATLTRDGDDLYVSARGTVPTFLPNWRVDLGAGLRWRPGVGAVHSGIWDAAEELWPQVQRDVLTTRGRLGFCGHSLGASLALCLASMAASHGVSSTILALAPARVGGGAFARSLDRCAVTVVRRANDLVTEVPWLFGLYRQPAPVLRLRADEIMTELDAHSAAGYAADFKAYLASKGPGPCAS